MSELFPSEAATFFPRPGSCPSTIISLVKPAQARAHVGADGRRRVFFKVSARFFSSEIQGCAIFLVSI